MGTDRIKLTDQRAQAVNPPARGRIMVYDAKLPGFVLRVTAAGAKSWVLYRRINGDPSFVTLGRFPDVKADSARTLATQALGKAAHGINPTDEKRAARATSITLGELLEEYLKARGGKLRERTAYQYDKSIRFYFAKWLDRPIVNITKDDCERRHKQVTLEHGPGAADQTFRILRAMLNYASDRYEDSQGRSILPENPTRRLSAGKVWNHLPRKQTIIKPHELPAWWKAVEAMPAEYGAEYGPESDARNGDGGLWRDYFQFLLLTGMRRGEAARLLVADVDTQARSFTLRDSKNHRDLTLPATDYLTEILERRIKAAGKSPNLFPGPGETGHIQEPKRAVRWVAEKSEVTWTCHDLRRTFATTAESLDLSAYALKALLGHRSGAASGDVTAGYVVLDVERLRGPAQKITDALLTQAGVKPGAKVVSFAKARKSGKAKG